MRCSKCGQEVGIDIIEHIRTRCNAPKKEKPTKQLSLWPKKENKHVQSNSSKSNG